MKTTMMLVTGLFLAASVRAADTQPTGQSRPVPMLFTFTRLSRWSRGSARTRTSTYGLSVIKHGQGPTTAGNEA
jgi:hypothetical protein